ncbi:tetratricopeptide repeat protein [Halopseudomonas salegens]|uniref:Tetratricopeptide repeat-containing protein n=1 Tax=Halopseudomonas salegens TaxID=1434072 RepID=A0A1H2G3E7_9GAMM|nr:tetratricopeptide repeat protein [Halopseudomonas salegens]SDU14085.1 Tetratricopeptide repeat-containing protein [Halopseudomonas salegens]
MNLLTKILLVLVVYSGFSFSAHAGATRHMTSTPAQQAAYDKAVALLDGWRGDPRALDAAKVKLDGVLRADPEFAPAHRAYARYYIMSSYISGGRYEPEGVAAAERSVDEALRLDPGYADAYVSAGNIYYLQDRLTDALDALDKARKIGTESPWLALNTANVLIAQGKHGDALLLYQSVIDSGTESSKAMSSAFGGLLDYYKGSGQFEKVEETYHRQIANDPDSAWLYGNYGAFLLCTKDDAEAAIVQFRMALDRMQYGMAISGLAAALYRQGISQPDNNRDFISEAKRLRQGTPVQVVTQFCHGGPAVLIMQNAAI